MRNIRRRQRICGLPGGMMDISGHSPAEAQPRVGTVSFDQSLTGLTGIALKGFLLSLATGGLYRFWYLSKLRRFFWSRTLIDGSPAAYTGSGNELFLGFLVAVAVLLPLQLGILVATLSVTALAAYVDILSLVALFLLGQFALYRGRRYRVSRTAWRGIRFRQDGSGLVYTTLAAGWWTLVLATAGLAYPFMRASLERYRIRHTLVGTSRLASEARGLGLLRSWLVLYAAAVFAVLAVLMILFAPHVDPACAIQPKHVEFPILPTALADNKIIVLKYDPCIPTVSNAINGVYIAFIAGFGAFRIFYPLYLAREIKSFTNRIRMGDARLFSQLKAWDYYQPYFVFTGKILRFFVILMIFYATFVVVMLITRWDIPQLLRQIFVGLALVAAVPWLIVNLVLAYVRSFSAGRWRVVAESTCVLGMDTVAGAMAESSDGEGRTAEGMADALDVGGALQIGF